MLIESTEKPCQAGVLSYIATRQQHVIWIPFLDVGRLSQVSANSASTTCCELGISCKQCRAKLLSDVYGASAVGACSSSVWQAVRSQSRIKTCDMSHLVHAQVLASDVNIGYEEIVNTQVHQVNGKPVKNLSDLTRQIEGCEDQYLRFDLEYNQVRGALSQILPCSLLCLTHDAVRLILDGWLSDARPHRHTHLQGLQKCLDSRFCVLKQCICNLDFAYAKVSPRKRGFIVFCSMAWPLHVAAVSWCSHDLFLCTCRFVF